MVIVATGASLGKFKVAACAETGSNNATAAARISLRIKSSENRFDPACTAPWSFDRVDKGAATPAVINDLDEKIIIVGLVAAKSLKIE
jgi:hypothetical protein